VGLILTLI